MPIATPIGDPTKRYDLESLPGGFVVLRRMTYGEKMQRRSFLSKAKMEAGGASNARDRRSQSNRAFVAELELMNEKVTALDWAKCIVEHNLTYLANPDDPTSETRLDFRIPDHIKMVDGRVGEEIDDLINEFNSWEVDEDAGK